MKEDNQSIEDKNQETPPWLKTIQLNSWEAELLVSALVLYALFQVPDLLRVLSLRHIPSESLLHGFFSIMIRAFELMKIGYILHILTRGIWVASVGLSYVFPKGINEKSLRFKGKFRKELNSNTSLVKNVLRLEELSSLIYGVSFLLFGSLLGFGTFTFSIIYLMEIVQSTLGDNFYVMGIFGLLLLFYLFLSLLVFIDFCTNGYFRRKNWSSDWFYPVAYFFRIVTLSFLYRRSLLVLISNVKGWKAHLIPIVILGVIAGYTQLEKKMKSSDLSSVLTGAAEGNYASTSYEDLRSREDILLVTIQSDIIDEGVLKVFLKDIRVFGSMNNHKNGSKSKWDLLQRDTVSMLLNSWLKVEVDETRIQDVDWFRSQHPTDYEFGFTSFIDISNVSRGSHNFKMSFDTTTYDEDEKEILVDNKLDFKYLSNIHFFYDK